MVVRDFNGNVLLSGVSGERLVQTTMHAEVKAILWGIKEAVHNGFDSLIVESDSLLAILEIQKAEASYWDEAALIFDILKWATFCTFCHFHHVKRSANYLAHSISKLDCNHGFQRIWHNSLLELFCNSGISI
ncbi:hypothetical protein REPUB_Repub02eG0064800 [Reevesia pubescens]